MNLEGGCVCSALRYTLTAAPLIVQACHCRDCQRLAASAFVVNAWIERAHVNANPDPVASRKVTGGSGEPHELFCCPDCGTCVWSRYHAAPESTVFVRVGTLDRPDSLAPAVHIFTRSKLPWVMLPEDVPQFEAFYSLKEVWSPESLARLRASTPSR